MGRKSMDFFTFLLPGLRAIADKHDGKIVRASSECFIAANKYLHKLDLKKLEEGWQEEDYKAISDLVTKPLTSDEV